VPIDPQDGDEVIRLRVVWTHEMSSLDLAVSVNPEAKKAPRRVTLGRSAPRSDPLYLARERRINPEVQYFGVLGFSCHTLILACIAAKVNDATHGWI
jgi:hypothetical protein